MKCAALENEYALCAPSLFPHSTCVFASIVRDKCFLSIRNNPLEDEGKELFVIHRLTDGHSAMQPCSDLFICFIFLFVLVIIVPPSSANTECVWAIGQLKCDSYPDRLANTVVEIWDEDGSQRVGIQTYIHTDRQT